MAGPNFLKAIGTNGYIATPFTVLSSELNGLTTGSLSAAGAAQSNVADASAILAAVLFESGGAFTPSSSIVPVLEGWIIESKDGGSVYEKSGAAPARQADFTIPLLGGTALASGDLIWCQNRRCVLSWSSSYKFLLRNNCGATFPANNNNKIWIAPIAIQY